MLVPLRAIFESLDATVDYDSSTKTITGNQNGKLIILRIHEKVASVDGEKVMLDVPASIVKGSTLVPVRFIGESLGANVDWTNNMVLINYDRDKTPTPVEPTKPKQEEFVKITKESIVGRWKEVENYTADGVYKEVPGIMFTERTFFSNNTTVLSFRYKGSSYDSKGGSFSTYEVVDGNLFTVGDDVVQHTPMPIKMSKDGRKLYEYSRTDGSACVYHRQ